jgi:hypothetical protein
MKKIKMSNCDLNFFYNIIGNAQDPIFYAKHAS